MITYMCVCVCVYLNKIFFVRNYDFIYMIMFNLTMKLFWYPANRGYSLVLWYPANGGLFIGTLIPKLMGVYSLVLWYPANGGYSLVFWYLNYSDTQPIGVIHWYSDAQSRGKSVTIVIRLLRIWITFEHLTILSP